MLTLKPIDVYYGYPASLLDGILAMHLHLFIMLFQNVALHLFIAVRGLLLAHFHGEVTKAETSNAEQELMPVMQPF